jgi:pimeloyl-ACP methyl ester carboxylesterase
VSTGREVILTFGPTATNVGVLSLVDAPAPEAGVVLLNPGLIHRIGNGRLNVRLARVLAAHGVPSLRFDFSGIGDSVRRTDRPRSLESAVEEVEAAIALLRERAGVSRVVLYGLCGGADVAEVAALSSPHVSGLVLVDPHVHRTPRYWVHLSGLMLAKPHRATAALFRLVRDVRRQPVEEAARDFPSREEWVRSVRTLLDRGVDLWCCFTGGYRERYLYRGQFRDASVGDDDGGRIVERWMPRADHLLTGPADHEDVIDGLLALTRPTGAAPPS